MFAAFKTSWAQTAGGWMLIAGALAFAVWLEWDFSRAARHGLGATSQHAESLPLAWPTAAGPAVALDGARFKKTPLTTTVPVAGTLAKRYRLAGTFFAVGENQEARKAILDDLRNKDQRLVSDGEWLDDTVRVAAVFPDHIVLRSASEEETLRLNFAESARPQAPGATTLGAAPASVSAGGQTRFGRQVDERQWVLNRAELLGYYRELLNQPDRLAKVFESLEPVYQANAIAGYVLKTKGEAESFAALGIRENDVIRKVNSMPMTNRRRAEYFIKEFVSDRANAFAVEIERDGQLRKQIYMIR